MENKLEEKYIQWKGKLLFGIFVWPFCAAFVVFGNALIGTGGGTDAQIARSLQGIYLIAVIFAEVLAITFLIYSGSLYKKSEIKKAIAMIKIPFYYLLCFLVIFFAIDML